MTFGRRRANATLEMRTACEPCNTTLDDAGEAVIGRFECTRCATCGSEMQYRRPNCGGELVSRPRRGAAQAPRTRATRGASLFVKYWWNEALDTSASSAMSLVVVAESSCSENMRAAGPRMRSIVRRGVLGAAVSGPESLDDAASIALPRLGRERDPIG